MPESKYKCEDKICEEIKSFICVICGHEEPWINLYGECYSCECYE